MVTVPAPTNTPPVSWGHVNGGFPWREDESLKAHLKDNIVVWDQTAPAGGRPVPVYFRMPETETRARTFPYVMIDNLGYERDPEREMVGGYYLSQDVGYHPDGTYVPSAGSTPTVRRQIRAMNFVNEYSAQMLPVPVMIRYQVQAWMRNRVQAMWITNAMLQLLPNRFGAINMVSVTRPFPVRDDNTVRRLDLLDGPVHGDAPDPEQANKRVFSRTWTVGISSEILPSDLERASLVGQVVVDPPDRAGYSSVVIGDDGE